jgi:hypothetical protein
MCRFLKIASCGQRIGYKHAYGWVEHNSIGLPMSGSVDEPSKLSLLK